MKQEIYILAHKEIDNKNVDLSDYIPIQVGASSSDKDIYPVKDNTGDNISIKNQYYLETTGIYWIWKNSDADIKGQMQFRRFLSVNTKFIPMILENYDIITANPINIKPISLEEHYSFHHNAKNLQQIKNIIDEYYPQYSDSYGKCIKNGTVIYYSNSFIAKKETYDSLCDFVFGVLKIFEEKYHIDDENERTKYAEEKLDLYNRNLHIQVEYNKGHPTLSYLEYQKRICGYLFERLVTLYMYHNRLKIYRCGDYLKMENKMSI